MPFDDSFLSVYFTEYADPLGSDYQQRLGRISIGLGQLQGEGLFKENYWYVPEMQNDFVFSFICQALGFVGALIVVALLCGICFLIYFRCATGIPMRKLLIVQREDISAVKGFLGRA